MKFPAPLQAGTLVRRYKRFLADIVLPDGQTLTVHCPNPGSMKTCLSPGWSVRISDSGNEKRKLRHTLEMLHNGQCWIGVNPTLANRLALEAIAAGNIPELAGYPTVQTEVKYGSNSRIDLLLSGSQYCYVEVKSVTLLGEDGSYQFPDAVTTRGQKHLDELMEMVRQGHRAAMLYVIQRSDGQIFRPAAAIDGVYAAKLAQAYAAGVAIIPYLADVSPQEIRLTRKVDFALDQSVPIR